MDKIIMSKKEIEQVSIFESLNRKETSQKAASEILNISERQVRKKLKKFRENGIASLAHGNRGRKSPRKWSARDEEIALNLLRTKWIDFGPTFAAEQLNDSLGIKISREILRKIMIQGAFGLFAKNKKSGEKEENVKEC